MTLSAGNVVKKRGRTDNDDSPSKTALSMGTTEFISVLNGDDLRSILESLRRFVDLCKYERNLALGIPEQREEEDEGVDEFPENDGDEDEEEDLSNQVSNKRGKKELEDWKQDVANYNVPFVGTSVSLTVKDRGKIIKGQWPTGFLLAFLERSPLAVELTGNHLYEKTLLLGTAKSRPIKNHDTRLAGSITKQYLKALSELITSAISVDRLRDERSIVRGPVPVASETPLDDAPMGHHNTSNTNYLTIVSQILKGRLGDLFNLLTVETDGGRGLSSVKGGCGPLAPSVLQLLIRLALTSVSSARHLARALEQQHLPEAVLGFLLKQRQPISSENVPVLTTRTQAKLFLLKLTTILLSYSDPVITHCIISSSNSKSMGLLQFICREGFCLNRQSEEHLQTIPFLLVILKWITSHLLIVHFEFMTLPRRKMLLDCLLSKEFLQAMVQIALWPPVPKDIATFMEQLESGDSDHDREPIERLANSARVFIFVLLTNKDVSPLLESIEKEHQHQRTNPSGSKKNDSSQRLVAKMLHSLLSGAVTAENGSLLPIHNFVLLCLIRSPTLLPLFFCYDVTLDLKQDSFSTIQYLHFISKVLTKGPPLGECAKDLGQIQQSVLPAALKKQVLVRLLKSSNVLIVVEVLRLYICSLRRLKQWFQGLETEVIGGVLETFTQQRMPDIYVIISILQSNGPSSSSSNPIVLGRAANMLSEASMVVPAWVNEKKLDWLKVIPISEDAMLSTYIHLQFNVLHCLHEVLKIQKDFSSIKSASSLGPLFKLLIRTHSTHIHRKTWEILLHLLVRRDVRTCSSLVMLDHEAGCWIDGMREDCLEEFLKTLDKSASLSGIRGWADCAALWQELGLPEFPTPPCSALLLYSLQELEKASSIFQALVCQVAARCMMFQTNAQHLAAVILSRINHFFNCHSGSSMEVSRMHKSLQQYSRAITSNTRLNESELSEFLSHLLSRKSALFEILDSSISGLRSAAIKASVEDHVTAARYLAHCLANTTNDSPIREKSFSIFRRFVVPLALSKDQGSVETIQLGYKMMMSCMPRSAAVFSLALSYCDANNVLPKETPVSSVPILSNRDLRQTFLGWFVTAHVSPLEYLTKRIQGMLDCSSGISVGDPSLTPFFVRHLDCFTEKVGQRVLDNETKGLVAALLDIWTKLALPSSARVLGSVQRALAKTMETESALSFNVCLKLESILPESVILKSLEIEQDSVEANPVVMVRSFTELLIESDYVRYAGAYLKVLTSSEESGKLSSTRKHLFSSKALFAALRHVEELLVCLESKKRIVIILIDVVDDCRLLYDSLSTFSMDTLSSCSSALLERVFRGMLALSSNRREGSAKLLDLSVLTYRACKMAKMNCENLNSLGAFVFDSLSSSTVRQLRIMRKDPSSSNVAKSCNLLTMFEFSLSDSLTQGNCATVTGENLTGIIELIRSCVKHGLGTTKNDQADHPVRQKCLELILSALQLLSDASLSEAMGKSLGPVVFQLITSHSNFSELLVQEPHPLLKILLLRILLSCIENVDNIPFDSEAFSSVLSGYKAGLSVADTFARKFLLLYSKSAPADTKCCFMDQLRWGFRGATDSGLYTSNWEWLPSWIELSRVSATLKRFPYDENLHPLDVEVTESTSPADWSRPGNNQNVPGESNAPLEDKRYSPAFLLPLALDALETKLLEDRLTGVRDHTGYHLATGQLQSGPVLLQKLCEKGVIALTLGALCCDCPEIRRVAISILFHAVTLIHTEEARQLSSWRERPQMALILDSVRRGLVKEVAEHSDVDVTTIKQVPIISPSCAVFIGKASLILSSPADDLYPSINRYFLRIGSDHGAMQDFHRFPAFIALFCSSAVDDGIAAKERCWAVETLRDGFINGKCYGPLMGCHGLELLLTRIESMANSQKGYELDLIISAVARVVECCGSQGTSYLLNRLGLVSWLCSLILGRNILQGSHKTRSSIFNLLSAVIEKARGVLAENELAVMLQGLPEAALQPHLESAISNDKGRVLSDWVPLQNLLKQLRCSFAEDVHEASDGIQMSTVVRFLERIEESESSIWEDMLLSVCSLPVHIDKTNCASGKEFCNAVLRTLSRVDKPTKLTCSKAMFRINLVAKAFPPKALKNDELERLGLLVRPLCCRWEASRLCWIEFSNSWM